MIKKISGCLLIFLGLSASSLHGMKLDVVDYNARLPRSSSHPNILNPNSVAASRPALPQHPPLGRSNTVMPASQPHVQNPSPAALENNNGGLQVSGSIPVDVNLPQKLDYTLNHSIPDGTKFPEVPPLSISTGSIIDVGALALAIYGISMMAKAWEKKSKPCAQEQEEGKKLQKFAFPAIAIGTSIVLREQIKNFLLLLFYALFKKS